MCRNNNKETYAEPPAATSSNNISQTLQGPLCSTTPHFTSTLTQSKSSTEDETADKLIEILGLYPYDAPPGFSWVLNGWKLMKDTQ